LSGRAPCEIYCEAGIARPDRNDTFYVADIAISCEGLSPDDRLLRAPLLIVEVLSPSTSISDRQIKLADYRRPLPQEAVSLPQPGHGKHATTEFPRTLDHDMSRVRWRKGSIRSCSTRAMITPSLPSSSRPRR
jgi:Putative restriction endonuclease